MMRESRVESYLREQVREKGGRCYKWVSPGNIGVPDRIAMIPGGKIGFIECKRPTRDASKTQQIQLDLLADLGFMAFVVENQREVDTVIRKILKQ